MINIDINIEKTILASVLFEPNLFVDVFKILEPDDFTHHEYKKIYVAMKILHDEDLPIDEEFIRRKVLAPIDNNVLIDVISTNPVSNIVEYAKELKRDSIVRQIKLASLSLQQKFDINLIDKLQHLKEQLESVNGIKKLKTADTQYSFFDKIDLDPTKVEEVTFSYLLDNFIVQNEITMIAARPATGKSLTAFAMANMVLHNKKIDTVYYLDGDNGMTTIKERKIHYVKQKWGKALRYIQGKSTNEYQRVIKELRNMDLANDLVVFDSIKNFMFGGDRDKNKDVSKVMEVLKTLRNNGATVIFLHHSNKPQKDIDELMYAGSSAWEEDTSNAYILKKNDDKKAFIFIPIKKRAGDLYEQAYSYDSDNHWLHQLDLVFAKQTKEDEDMINETIEYLKSSRNKPMWSELWKNLTELGYDKEKASKVIKNGEGKFWISERGERNNQKLFSLIAVDKHESMIVYEFEYIKTAPRTQITPRSPFYNASKSSEVSQISPRSTESLRNFDEFEKIKMPKIAI